MEIPKLEIPKRVFYIFLSLLIVLLVGMSGYLIIEHWTLLEALYMTVITLTTVGFMEVHPLSPAGRVFTVFLLLSGIGILAYSASSLLEFIIEGELTGLLRRRKMEKKIQNLRGHYIICGAGEVGKYVIDELMKINKQFVVIETNEEQIKKLQENKDILLIEGNPAEDGVLIRAGIQNATGLISALSSDKDNLFVVLTARNINPNIRIVSRAIDEASVPKLSKAGADKVVSTEAIGGLRMASEMLRPAVVTFLDMMLRDEKATLRVEEVEILSRSNLIGKTLEEVDILQKTGLTVLAVKDALSGKYLYNPSPVTKLKEKDILIVLGDIEQVGKLNNLVI